MCHGLTVIGISGAPIGFGTLSRSLGTDANEEIIVRPHVRLNHLPVSSTCTCSIYSPSHSRCLQPEYTSTLRVYLIMVVSLSLRLIATPWLDLSGKTNAEAQSQPLLLSGTHRSTGCKCSVAFSGAWPTWPHTPCHAPGKECPSPAPHVPFTKGEGLETDFSELKPLRWSGSADVNAILSTRRLTTAHRSRTLDSRSPETLRADPIPKLRRLMQKLNYIMG